MAGSLGQKQAESYAPCRWAGEPGEPGVACVVPSCHQCVLGMMDERFAGGAHYLDVQQAFSEAAYLSGYDLWALGRARVRCSECRFGRDGQPYRVPKLSHQVYENANMASLGAVQGINTPRAGDRQHAGRTDGRFDSLSGFLP